MVLLPANLKKIINKKIKAIIRNIHDEYTGSLNTVRKRHEIAALDGGQFLLFKDAG